MVISAWSVAVAMLFASMAPVSAQPDQGERSSTTPAAVAWPEDREAPDPLVANPAAPVAKAPPKKHDVPPPRVVDPRPAIEVAVGLDPSAPGTKAERALVDSLERSIPTSTDPPAKVRRLRAGSPSGREVCRAGRDDLVVLVGYVPSREDPVLLAHDCRLDHALDLREGNAAADGALAGALWDEHDRLVRQGVKERRRLKGLSPRARAGIIGGVAVVLVGVAVGVLVASALRDEKVVLKVSP